MIKDEGQTGGVGVPGPGDGVGGHTGLGLHHEFEKGVLGLGN